MAPKADQSTVSTASNATVGFWSICLGDLVGDAIKDAGLATDIIAVDSFLASKNVKDPQVAIGLEKSDVESMEGYAALSYGARALAERGVAAMNVIGEEKVASKEGKSRAKTNCYSFCKCT